MGSKMSLKTFNAGKRLQTLGVVLFLVFVFGSLAILFAPFDWLILKLRSQKIRPGPLGSWIKKNWSRSMLSGMGIRVQLSGEGVNDYFHHQGMVFVSNHQSVLDILSQMSVLPSSASFISKKELKWIPFFGWAANVVGTIFVDRVKGTHNDSLDSISESLRAGASIIVYPEGTRSSDGRLLPFKRGAFVMAIDAQVPIVPLTILDSRDLCPKHQSWIASGTIHIVIDKPISTQGMTPQDRFDLSERIQGVIAKHLEKFGETRKNEISA